MVVQWLERLRGVDLRELDFGDCGTWSAGRKTLVAGALAVLVVALGYGALLQSPLSRLEQQLPTQAQVPGLLEDVSRLGRTAGLKIEKIQWLPEVPQPFHAELPLRLTLIGGFHELGLFVSDIARLPRIITLHDFALQPLGPQGGELRMNLLAKTYRSHDQGLLP